LAERFSWVGLGWCQGRPAAARKRFARLFYGTTEQLAEKVFAKGLAEASRTW
jgi:hypothetical protein